MIEDILFQDEGQVTITAASVGISKLRWTSIKEEEIESNKHLELMTKNRFDHLPIEPKAGTITEFFKTVEPNKFEKIERRKINYNDVIPLEINIRDVIEKFANENRTFFFLRYQRNISGLITLGNLNCKQVQIYIFSLMCELERELGDFLNSYLTNQKIKQWVENKINKPNDKYANIIKKHNELTKEDLENQLTELFYFIDFLNIIEDKNLFTKLDFTNIEWNELKIINKLRNQIAHPTSSLLDKDNDINDLLKRINKIEDLLFRLTTKRKNSSR